MGRICIEDLSICDFELLVWKDEESEQVSTEVVSNEEGLDLWGLKKLRSAIDKAIKKLDKKPKKKGPVSQALIR